MWVFLASNDCTSSSKLDSSVTSASHAAQASIQQLGFHDKQENAELGFHDKPEATQFGSHDMQHLAKLGQVRLHYSLVHGEPAHLRFHDNQDFGKPGQLGFHDKFEHPGPAQLGFHDKNGHVEAGQVRFHMNLRRLANGAVTTPNPAQVSPSIVVIIIVLTVIFFLSAFLHLLIRWLARNPALIRRGLRTGAGTGSNNRIIALTALQGQLQQLFSMQDAGLERSLIEELPVFSYKAAMDGLKEGADCAICLCEFVGDDQLRLLPLCGHAFHTECIDTWLLSHSTCPLCRTLLIPECWIPGTLQPLLSSEISTAGEADHQHIADVAVLSLSGRFNGLGSSSRRSSLTMTTGTPLVDHNHSQLAPEPQLLHLNPFNPIPNRIDSAISENPDVAYPVSVATSSSRGMAKSARLASSNPERLQSFTEIGSLYASSESQDRTNHTIKKGTNEGTSSANTKSSNGSNSAITAIMDSGRLSYTSLGAQSETYNELDGASTYGSGRRVSVHLGKCRVVHEEGKSTRIPKASGDASRRSYSKGSYEYVIDSSSNLQVIIPPVITSNRYSRPPAQISGSRLNELLNLSNRTSSSSTEIMQNAAHVSRDLVNKNLSLSWGSASFRKLRLCNGEDVDTSVEAMNAPLNTSLPSDKPASVECLPAVITPELAESSGATSMRVNVGSDASFSPEMVNQRLKELNVGSNGVVAKDKTAKRAVSFRLPTPGSHEVLKARLKASASRRALSESEAFSYWEPTITEQNLDHANDDQRLFLENNTGSHHRSSSFARRTMDWLVGWQKRMVHPDKSVQANSSCNQPS